MRKNIKIWITYFFNIRFLEPHQLPLSTANWDPAWYRKQGRGQAWLDSRRVMCGLRLEQLTPKSCNATIGCCPCSTKDPYASGSVCEFLKSYAEGLRKINFEDFWKCLEIFQECFSIYAGKEAELVLVVYETPENPCSERKPLVDWFLENGVEVEEYKPLNNIK